MAKKIVVTTVGELMGGGYRIRGSPYDGAEITGITELVGNKYSLTLWHQGQKVTWVLAGTAQITVEDDPFLGL